MRKTDEHRKFSRENFSKSSFGKSNSFCLSLRLCVFALNVFLFRAAERMMRIALRRRALHFGNRDDRQEFHEQQIQHEKRAERADIKAHVPNRRMILAPVRREKI